LFFGWLVALKRGEEEGVVLCGVWWGFGGQRTVWYRRMTQFWSKQGGKKKPVSQEEGTPSHRGSWRPEEGFKFSGGGESRRASKREYEADSRKKNLGWRDNHESYPRNPEEV